MRSLWRQGTRALAAACAIVVVGAAGTAGAQLPGLPQLPALPGLPRRHARPALRHERRRRLLEHPPSGAERSRSVADIAAFSPPARRRRRTVPTRHARSTPPRSCRCTATSCTRRPGLSAADIPKYSQGRDLRRQARRGRAHRLASRPRRRDDRARQELRRAAHLRHDARGHDVRRSATPAPRTACSSWTCCATPAARSCPRSPAARGQPRHGRTTQWALAPYTEADLQRQFDLGDDVYGAAGAQLQDDVTQLRRRASTSYITEARLNPTKMPGEYAAIGQARRARRTGRSTDVIATASLVGGIFGKGGGARARLGAAAPGRAEALRRARAGRACGRSFAAVDDPEAPTTVKGKRFPYQRRAEEARAAAAWRCPTAARRGATGSTCRRERRRRRGAPRRRSPSAVDRALGGLPGLPLCPLPRRCPTRCSSRARKSKPAAPRSRCSARRSAYFAPADPDGARTLARTGHRRRAAPRSPGVNLYVQLGHGRDYAWSATSAGQDIIDTFAVPLCEPDGSAPTIDSMHYLFRGQCLPIEVLEQHEHAGRRTWPTRPRPAPRRCAPSAPSSASSPAAAPYTGKPVRLHEAALDLLPRGRLGASASRDFNDPDKIRDAAGLPARRLARSATRSTGSTSTHTHIAYFNSGNNPVRAARVDLALPGELGASSGATGTPTCRRRSYAVAGFAPAGDRPAVPRQLEQQAGARLPRGRRQLRLRLGLPLAAARRPHPERHPRRPQDVAARS